MQEILLDVPVSDYPNTLIIRFWHHASTPTESCEMNHRSLTDLLDHLPEIAISQIGQDQRSCGICWDDFSSNSLIPPDGRSSEQEESSASASIHTLGETAPFLMHALTPTSHVVVKTEVCVEREILPDVYTNCQGRQQGEDTGSGGLNKMSRLRAVDDPVQMQCGHMFGRNCLRSW